MLTRRGVLGGLIASASLIAAPAVIRSGLLMRVRPLIVTCKTTIIPPLPYDESASLEWLRREIEKNIWTALSTSGPIPYNVRGSFIIEKAVLEAEAEWLAAWPKFAALDPERGILAGPPSMGAERSNDPAAAQRGAQSPDRLVYLLHPARTLAC